MADFFRLRGANADDADALTELAHASKRHWGYPDAWMETWREALTITPTYIDAHEVTVILAQGGECVGFAALVRKSDECVELDHLFVRPGCMGRGVGRLLFDDAVTHAGELGYRTLTIDADPFASGFYARVGAELCGVVPAPMPGHGPDGWGDQRTRPQYRFDLSRE